MRSLRIALAGGVLLAGVAAQQTDSLPTSRPAAPKIKARSGGFYGLTIAEVRRGDGVALEIGAVQAGSDAERLGFRAGDRITDVCGQPFANGDDFFKLLYGTLPGRVGELARRMMKLEKPEGDPYLTVERAGEGVRIAGGLADLDRAPAVGDPAPDFTLADPTGEREVTLSELIGARPVVLVFGSYT